MLYFYKTTATKTPKNYKISVRCRQNHLRSSSSSRVLNTLRSIKEHVSNKRPSVRDMFLINASFRRGVWVYYELAFRDGWTIPTLTSCQK